MSNNSNKDWSFPFTEQQMYQWFQESTINHHIEEDGSHQFKRINFIAEKAWQAALQSRTPMAISDGGACQHNWIAPSDAMQGYCNICGITATSSDDRRIFLDDKLLQWVEDGAMIKASDLKKALEKA